MTTLQLAVILVGIVVALMLFPVILLVVERIRHNTERDRYWTGLHIYLEDPDAYDPKYHAHPERLTANTTRWDDND